MIGKEWGGLKGWKEQALLSDTLQEHFSYIKAQIMCVPMFMIELSTSYSLATAN